MCIRDRGPAGLTQALYSITVSNAGPDFALGSTAVVTLPAGTSFVPANSSSACSAAGPSVTCSLGTIGIHGTASLAVAATAPVKSSLYTATAIVSWSGTDPVPGNNSASATYSAANVGVAGVSGEIPLPLWALAALGASLGFGLRSRRPGRSRRDAGIR